jgi:DNA invertase Pin-like site-specific DNA recombinase
MLTADNEFIGTGRKQHRHMHAVPINQHQDAADVLLRVSSQAQAQDDRHSLPTQRTACVEFATRQGWTVHQVLEDIEVGTTVNRRGFQEVLRNLRNGLIGHVVVYDVDRTGRDYHVADELLRTCKAAGAQLHIERMPHLELGTGTEKADTDEFLFMILVGVGKKEGTPIRERTQRGRRDRVAQGLPIVGPNAPFGYTFTLNERHRAVGYAIDERFASIVRRIFEQVAEGVTLSRICAELNAEGVPTKSQVAALARPNHLRRRIGTTWRPDAISTMIHHPAYWGKPVTNRHVTQVERLWDDETHNTRKRYHKAARSAGEVVALSTDVWPAIVPEELALRAQVRLAANQEESARRMAVVDKEATLLRGGYVYCQQCGLPMTTVRYHRNSRKQTQHKASGTRYSESPYYYAYLCRRENAYHGRTRCGQSIAAEVVDAAVWRHVVRLAHEPELLEVAMAGWHTHARGVQQRRQQSLQNATSALHEAERDEQMSFRSYNEQTDARMRARAHAQWQTDVERMQAAEEHLARLTAEMANDPIEAQYSDMTAWAREWQHRVETESYDAKRQALHRLRLRVFVTPAESATKVMQAARVGTRVAGGEVRQFAVLLGWPAGVKMAEPWTMRPMVDGRVDEQYTVGEFWGTTEETETSESALAWVTPANGQEAGLTPFKALVGEALGEVGQESNEATEEEPEEATGQAATPESTEGADHRFDSGTTYR